jgi:hypothetical protein
LPLERDERFGGHEKTDRGVSIATQDALESTLIALGSADLDDPPNGHASSDGKALGRYRRGIPAFRGVTAVMLCGTERKESDRRSDRSLRFPSAMRGML